MELVYNKYEVSSHHNSRTLAYGVQPIEQDDDSEEGYDVLHQQPTYIIDSNLKGRVVWSQDDWPVDLFLEDLRTVMALE